MSDRPRSPVETVKNWLARPVICAVVVLVTYVGLAFLNDPHGYLGTDTGAKVATTKVMSEHHTFVPDVGYWAASEDPDARYHGLIYTYRFGQIYVGVTSLPMVLLGKPLWDLAGYRGALLLPMLGGLAAGFAARALARQCGATGQAAFWIVALASPMLLYSVDFWEHSIGAALMLWALVFLHRATMQQEWWWGIAAGAVLGIAYSMRTEALVFLAAGFGTAGLLLLLKRQAGRALALGAGGAASFGIMFASNQALETAVFGTTLRAGRAASFVAIGGSVLSLRVRETFVTALSPFPSYDREFTLLAVGLAAALVVLAVVGHDGKRRSVIVGLAAIVGVIYVLRFAYGVGFVPGALAAAPLGAVAVARSRRTEALRNATLLALVPLPLVFAFQLPGGALPQWGGRYFLASTLALAAVGTVHLPIFVPVARATFVAASIAVAAFGAAWMIQRTHDVADAGDRLNTRPEQVLISPDGFPPREFAGTYPAKRWLSVSTPSDLDGAVALAGKMGVKEFGLVAQCPPAAQAPPAFLGWHSVRTERVRYFPVCDFRVTTYSADGS